MDYVSSDEAKWILLYKLYEPGSIQPYVLKILSANCGVENCSRRFYTSQDRDAYLSWIFEQIE